MSDILVTSLRCAGRPIVQLAALSPRGEELIPSYNYSVSPEEIEGQLVFFASEGAEIEFSADPLVDERRRGFLIGLADRELLRRRPYVCASEKAWINTEIVRRQHCAEARATLDRAYAAA